MSVIPSDLPSSSAPSASSLNLNQKPFLKALHGIKAERPPVWFMRQAGRYLPEYQELRKKAGTFLDLCYTPKYAAEATLQPIRRFGFDASIIFSDILVIPDALGQKVTFETGHGPRLSPMETPQDFAQLKEELDLTHLENVFEALQIVKKALPLSVALIGFCGGPWTVASYMIAGQGTADQSPARLFAYQYPEAFANLIHRLTKASVFYLREQLNAGADVVQLFDSLTLNLSSLEYERWCIQPLSSIVQDLRTTHPQANIILFSRASEWNLLQLAESAQPDALGLGTPINLAWAKAHLSPRFCLQGNLDPLVLLAGGQVLDSAIDHITTTLGNEPYVFNLGHGILPTTPIPHVNQLLRRLRA